MEDEEEEEEEIDLAGVVEDDLILAGAVGNMGKNGIGMEALGAAANLDIDESELAYKQMLA